MARRFVFLISLLNGKNKYPQFVRDYPRMVAFCRVVCIYIFLCANVYALPVPGPEDISPIFANGTEGYTCFRIPAIVQTPSGTLLAFAEARRNSCADFGDVRIVMRTSRRGGKAWSSLQTVASNGTMQAGNPVPIVDTLDPTYPHGRIFLVYVTSDAPESAVREGHGTCRVWYRTSIDDGATWAAPVDITVGVKPDSWRTYATGPGHGLQLTRGPHEGRILIAANHSEGPPQPAARDFQAHTFFSDDHGQTWTLGATVPWPGGNESTIAQRADNALVMNIRDQSNLSHARIIAISKSDSQHWDSTFVARDLPDPVCEGSMISYAFSKDLPVLLFSNAGNKEYRRRLTVSMSADRGLTWPKHSILYDGPAAYSDLVDMGKGQVGILWERGNEGGIVFMSRPLKTLF